MEVFADGRIYVSKGEHCPYRCPQCEHIMEWRAGEGMITCEKCDCRGTPEDFSRVQWRLSRVN